MLYLLGRDRAADWVRSAAQALEPGGRLVVKELDVTPWWKARWSRFQEVLATRVMRITEGEELELIPRDDVVDAMREAGLTVRTRRLDHGRLHPHYVAVGTADQSRELLSETFDTIAATIHGRDCSLSYTRP